MYVYVCVCMSMGDLCGDRNLMDVTGNIRILPLIVMVTMVQVYANEKGEEKRKWRREKRKGGRLCWLKICAVIAALW